MRILLASYPFHPAIGGIETASMLFAGELTRRGHEVTVVTMTAGEDEAGWPFAVRRRPGPGGLMALMRRADLVWLNNISLHLAWPAAVIGPPMVTTHQTWLAPGWRSRVKWRFCTRGGNVFISRAVAARAPLPGVVIGNPYDDGIFRILDQDDRDHEIVLVARLVADKGVDVLIDALAILAGQGLRPAATIIGDGPERGRLRARAAAAGLDGQLVFRGPLRGAALARELNRHRILAVPSRWPEPFGIVALEGAACGCVVVGTAGGGLAEAIGPCGPIVANGDPAGLARGLRHVLEDGAAAAGYRAGAAAHLARFTPAAIMDSYETIFQFAANGAAI